MITSSSDNVQLKLRTGSGGSSAARAVSVTNERYPYCIVWTPIPVLTWLLPMFGHLGIADSRGIIYDFGGPYYIAEDNFSFGRCARYIQLDPSRAQAQDCTWDDAVKGSCDVYRRRMHNLLCDNCHNHVAKALQMMRFPYPGAGTWLFSRWNFGATLMLAMWMFCSGKFASPLRAACALVPSLVLYGLIASMLLVTRI